MKRHGPRLDHRTKVRQRLADESRLPVWCRPPCVLPFGHAAACWDGQRHLDDKPEDRS